MIKLFNVTNWDLSETHYEQLLSKVEESEKERIKKFKFLIDSKRSLSGLLIARNEISNTFNIPFGNVVIKRKENNKPYFVYKQFPSFDFNISHSGDFVAIILNKFSLVGIDIEKIEIKENYLRVL